MLSGYINYSEIFVLVNNKEITYAFKKSWLGDNVLGIKMALY